MVVRIAIGSLNPVKVRACEEAFKKFYTHIEVVPVKVLDGGEVMPCNFEVYNGARMRAEKSLEVTGASLGVGIEAGYVDILGRRMLTACCIVLDKEGNEGISYSLAFQPPAGITPSQELGKGVGIVGKLTDGIIVREKILQDALIVAISSLFKK